jgi:hypothetical protein
MKKEVVQSDFEVGRQRALMATTTPFSWRRLRVDRRFQGHNLSSAMLTMLMKDLVTQPG